MTRPFRSPTEPTFGARLIDTARIAELYAYADMQRADLRAGYGRVALRGAGYAEGVCDLLSWLYGNHPTPDLADLLGLDIPEENPS